MTAKTPRPFKFPFYLYGYSQAEVSTLEGNIQSRRHLTCQIRALATKAAHFVGICDCFGTGRISGGKKVGLTTAFEVKR